MSQATRGRFVTLEGIDGAGKSTHVASAREAIERRGERVVVTREPGGTPVGEKLRELLLNEPMGHQTEILLMFAARQEHLERVIWPALEEGIWVLCDRFTDATFAYQGGGRNVDFARIAALEQWVHGGFAPDLTLMFDVPVDVGLARIADIRSPDRFEREQAAFFQRVRDAYSRRIASEPVRFRLLDTTRPRSEIRAEIEAIIAAM